MADKMKDLTDEEKTTFIRAACRRIWIDGNNEIEIELSLPGLEAFAKRDGDGANDPRNTSFPQPQSLLSSGFLSESKDTTNGRCTPVEFCPSLPVAHILAQFAIRW